jgi:hypothetical protein
MRCSKLFRYFGSVVALTIFSSRGGAQTSVAAEIDTRTLSGNQNKHESIARKDPKLGGPRGLYRTTFW